MDWQASIEECGALITFRGLTRETKPSLLGDVDATHQSTTDPDARMARKGPSKEARLCYAGHVQMDNRHGLVVNTRLTPASGKAEPTAAGADSRRLCC